MRRARARRLTLDGLLVLYLGALLRITVLRDGCFAHGLWSGRVHWIPLRAYLQLLSWGSYGRAAYLFFGNIAWFMPLGAYVRLRRRPFAMALLAGLTLSLLIECGQFALGSGISETDDLLLNAGGAALGYAAMRALESISARLRKNMGRACG